MRRRTFLMLPIPLVCHLSGCREPETEQLRSLRVNAEEGDADSQFLLGGVYYNRNGGRWDDDRALEWFRKAAERGHADAQNYVGEMYYQGRGAVRDYTQAAVWYRKAAEHGNGWAQANLGTMSFDGQGVSRDAVEGYKWETLAIVSATDEALKKHASTVRGAMVTAMSQEQVAAAEEGARAWVSTDDLVRESAVRFLALKAGGDHFFIGVGKGPPSSSLLDRLGGKPQYRPITEAPLKATPGMQVIIKLIRSTWQSEQEALILASFSGSKLGDSAGLLLLRAERGSDGRWLCREVPLQLEY